MPAKPPKDTPLGPNPYARRGQLTPEKRMDAIAFIRLNGPRCAGVAKHIDVSQRLIEAALKDDPYFEEAWREAEEEYLVRVEKEADRRAVEGVTEPVFYQGVECGQIQRYSDSLLTLLLKRRDHGYREKVSADVSFGGGVLVVNGTGEKAASDADWAKQFVKDGEDDGPSGQVRRA